MPVSVIDHDTLLRMMQDDDMVQLVDVREKEEHEAGNIGGINIPLSQIEVGCKALNKEKPVVVYCASGTRSGKFAQELLQRGFKQVVSLDGGIRY